jgi:chemotaxis protein methyltransferase CheR
MEHASPKATGDSPGLPELGTRELDQIRRLMETTTGVHLTEAKGALVMARLGRRLRELRLQSYREYMAHLAANPESETAELVDRLLTNETRLFREGWQFEYLEHTIIPQWRTEEGSLPGRRRRIWSAACSTGEEPASLAAVMDQHFPGGAGTRVEILATDLSAKALSAAKTLTFPQSRAVEVPSAFARHFEEAGGDRVRLRPSAAKFISFQAMNLLAPNVPASSFDLVLCRNVLIYFTRETKRLVIDHMWRALKPGGYLFVGHAESLVGVIEGQRPVKPAIYRKPVAAKT